MPSNYYCFTEAAGDKLLYKIISGAEYIVKSQLGISNILKTMQERQGRKDEVLIGFIDNDKRIEHKHYKKFNKTAYNKKYVDVKKIEGGKQYLIIIKPALDLFLHGNLEETKKEPSVFKFPNDFKNFKNKIKSFAIDGSSDYKNLLNHLKIANPACIEQLREAIKLVHDDAKLK